MNGLLPDAWKLPGLEDLRPPSGRGARTASLVLLVASVAAVLLFVDLTPDVGRDLFFASDDPQLREDDRIRELFPTSPQIIVSARHPEAIDDDYVSDLADLSRDLRGIEGVLSVRDILHGPEDVEQAFENPLWRRLLVSEDGGATSLVVVLGTDELERVVPALEEALEAHRAPDFRLAVSGQPYVVEMIRRQVLRDLRVFGIGALLVFSLTMGLLYRSGWILGGTLVAAGTATALTLLGRSVLGLEVDLLTPNITTIVFVLTLLHVVFLTTNWQNAAAGGGEGAADPVRAGIRWTAPASFWAMVTTGLGFLSLLLAPAKPARNFGISCALGAVLAFACAYVLYPAFLRRADPAKRVGRELEAPLSAFFRRRHGAAVIAMLALALAAVPGLFRLDTDPELFAYFDGGGDVREGLERIDRAGGSSPLDLVIRDAGGGELANDDAFDRMWRLQRALEEDPAVGSVLSLPVLMAEAEEQTFLSFLLSWDFLLDRLEEPEHDRIARTFVNEDRTHARFLMRMKESARPPGQSREEVIRRLEADVREHGFVPVLTGGLYALQGKMSDLVASSLWTGLLGLTALFAGIAFVVARSIPVAAAMILGFSMIPLVLLGVFGTFRVPLDVISLPAANLALAIGVDDMVHVAFHARRSGDGERRGWEAWVEAREALWRAILISSVVVALGFGLLLLSGFPPTRRLGFAVVLGTAVAVAVVLVVFPRLAVFLVEAGEQD